jgi:molybdenum cofactor cytidylyltransferase
VKAKIGIIILAAGAGSRFAASGGDSPKQLVSIDGVSMLQRAVNLANQLLPGAVHVVLGSESHTIKSQLYSCDIIINRDWQLGLGNSIAGAVKQLVASSSSYDGLLIMLGDQPRVNIEGITEILNLFDGERAICAYYGNRDGVPALFPEALFADLMALDGDFGAKILLQSIEDKLIVPMPEAAIDIDSVEDLKQLV